MGGALLCGLWSCSSDNTPDNPGNNPGATVIEGDAFLGVQINLPSLPSTRGSENDQFDDGTPNEYKVENAYLLLFTGSNESSATFLKGYKLDGAFETNSPSTDNITSSDLETVDLAGLTIADGSELYGLVMLNVPSTIKMGESNPKDFTAFTITTKDGDQSIGTSTTFEDMQAYITGPTTTFVNGDGATASNFFMTNAPLSAEYAGGTQSATIGVEGVSPKITYLTAFDQTKIKNTVAEAKKDPAGCVYVERAVSKVTSSVKNGLSYKVGETTFNISAEMLLVQKNESSYFFRNVNSIPAKFAWTLASQNIKVPGTNDDYYRMIGHTGIPTLYFPFHTTVPNPQLYRTYWCQDPNYTAEGSTAMGGLSTYPTSIDGLTFFASGVPQYCFENTFDVAHQNYGNTTLALFKVTMKTGDDATGLYIVNDNKDKIYTSAADVETLVKDYIFRSYNEAIVNALNAAVKDEEESTINAFNAISDKAKLIKVTFATDGTSYKATDIALADDAKTNHSDVFGDDSANAFTTALNTKSDILTSANRNIAITAYVGGVSYYLVPIMHFGDAGTPLPDDFEESEKINTDQAYGTGADAAKDYLGRYGLVRNNWYDVQVSEIKKIGDPVIPTLDATLSDDNNKVEKHMAVEIHVFSWAKRTQSSVLGK